MLLCFKQISKTALYLKYRFDISKQMLKSEAEHWNYKQLFQIVVNNTSVICNRECIFVQKVQTFSKTTYAKKQNRKNFLK
jgi:hypothetical protein